jgi:23S rRNA G2445 N2-methylase RlmL
MAGMATGEQSDRWLRQVLADNAEMLRRLAASDQDARSLAQAKVAYAAAKPDDWIEYTDEDLEALRQGYVALDEEVDKDFFKEDEPPAHGVGWCAPSP